MKIDRGRLEGTIEELGRIGETPRGGLTRVALTDEDKRRRDWLVARMRDPATLERARGLLDDVVKAACQREGVTYDLQHYWQVPYTPFAPDVIAAVERAAKTTGARYRRMRSGAGHDAQYMAAIGPAGMIFVPSRDGRSHCEEEFTAIADIEDGANTLLLTALDLAGSSS